MNDWFDKVHVPDLLQIPGFVNGSRFVNPDFSSWESGKYLVTYEIETEDISQNIAALEENVNKWRKQGRMSELISLVSRVMYRQISFMTK